jgi:DNA-binding response OmpR family regulator
MYKVLLIEDDYYIRDLYKTVFTKAGYTVDTAEDGEVGIEKNNRDKYDALLLDIMMPKMNGIEVLKTVRGSGNTIPIFLITNLGQESVIKEAFELGADGYFMKSQVTVDELVKEITAFLDKMKSGQK